MRFVILMIAGGSVMICVLIFSQQTRRTLAMAGDQRVGSGRVAWQFETGG
jgi:hypothetical protein